MSSHGTAAAAGAPAKPLPHAPTTTTTTASVSVRMASVQCYVKREIQQVDTQLLSYCLRKVQHSIRQPRRRQRRPRDGYPTDHRHRTKTLLFFCLVIEWVGFLFQCSYGPLKLSCLVWRAFKLKNDYISVVMGWLNKVSEEAEEEALVKGKNEGEREKKGM